MTTAPDMLMEFGGSPVGSGRFSSPWAKHYFVDDIDGSAGNAGLRPDDAMKTIQQAVDLATGGDVIYIRPQRYNIDTMYGRYAEDVTITMAADLTSGDAVVDGMRSIIGVSANTFNADFSGVRWHFTTGPNLTNDTPGLHVENIGFFSEGATTAGVLLQYEADTKRGSEGSSFYHCAFKGMGLYVRDGGDGLVIDSCRFQPKYDGSTVADINLRGVIPLRRSTIRNCEWFDANGTASIHPCITVAGTTTELLIRDCYFPKIPSGGLYINTAGAVHGLISNCYFNHDDLDTDGGDIALGTGVTAVACYDATGFGTT